MTEADWTLLNAYADGELGRADAAALSARLARDPGLAGELLRIRRLKQRLAGLQEPDRRSGESLGAPAGRSLRPVAAVAASLAVAAVIACFAIIGPTGRGPDADPVLALHSELGRLPHAETPPADIGDIPPPDLSASNLRLFASRSGEAATGYHYRGPNGCRLTLVIGAALELPDGTLAHRWAIGERIAVLIAEGMDPHRFAAVASYTEAATRGADPGDRLRLAVVERTASSRPCA